MYNKGVIGACWFIFYVGKMAFDNSASPPKTLYQKYIVSTQSLYAFTSALELYKLFGAVMPARVTSYVINSINASNLGVSINNKLNTMASYVLQNMKNAIGNVFKHTSANISSFISGSLAQKFTYVLNALQVVNAVAYFLGGLYTAYSAYKHFQAGEPIQAGLDIASSGMYFFAAAATVVGVLFSIPGAQPLAIIFATVGFVLQVVKWFLPKSPHPLAKFLENEVHPSHSYIDLKNCQSHKRSYYDCGDNIAAISKVVGRNLVKSPEGFGGTGGKKFDDFLDTKYVNENTKIRRIAFWECHGYNKTGFEVFYRNGNEDLPKRVHGCTGGSMNDTMRIIDIADNEELTSMKVHKTKHRG